MDHLGNFPNSVTQTFTQALQHIFLNAVKTVTLPARLLY